MHKTTKINCANLHQEPPPSHQSVLHLPWLLKPKPNKTRKSVYWYNIWRSCGILDKRRTENNQNFEY